MLRCILYLSLSILNKTRRSRLFYFFRIAFRVYSLVFSQKAKKICSGGKNILVIWNQTIWVRIVRSVLINISLSEIRAFKKRKKERMASKFFLKSDKCCASKNFFVWHVLYSFFKRKIPYQFICESF
jgi:hypothetical protein